MIISVAGSYAALETGANELSSQPESFKALTQIDSLNALAGRLQDANQITNAG
ncbi:hypothetical protein BIZ37_26655 [Photobacterium sp. BZF1]|uniref:hypothetical protein n=1 Tax=Photobacterium sp. BZF1 TaxID=1904457 RepID=UPI001653AA50|nr:hypothetical protein [Photobacterium sp. BZF1]MBC7006146.1 hypothetical protein [Photobacterium sp. BZF1]